MIIETDNYLAFEVTFSLQNREEGFNDDIRLAMRESGPPTARILRADRCSLLLTPNQAERLAEALLDAVQGKPSDRKSRAANKPSTQRRGSALDPARTSRARRA